LDFDVVHAPPFDQLVPPRVSGARIGPQAQFGRRLSDGFGARVAEKGDELVVHVHEPAVSETADRHARRTRVERSREALLALAPRASTPSTTPGPRPPPPAPPPPPARGCRSRAGGGGGRGGGPRAPPPPPRYKTPQPPRPQPRPRRRPPPPRPGPRRPPLRLH